jgi:hypothetical protein
MTLIEIAMMCCASFRWPVIVMKQLHEKTGEKKCDDDNERRHGNNGNIVKRGDKKYIEKERKKVRKSGN